METTVAVVRICSVWKSVAFCSTLIWSITAAAIVPLQHDVREFCQFDTFIGRCPDDHVIQIDHAHYGRMRSGRCISGEGYIGCTTDVRAYLEETCAGRRGCNVTVTSLTDVVQPCRRDYMSYLEVAYSCRRVAYDDSDQCQRSNEPAEELRGKRGLIASTSLLYQQAGSDQCPWTVRVDPGQKIQLKLIVYKAGADAILTAVAGSETECPWTAVIKDDASEFTKQENLCSKRTVRSLYTSDGSSIRIYFRLGKAESTPIFVVQYDAIGCPDIVVDSESGLKVTRNGDELRVQCRDYSAKDTWYLTCADNKWIGEFDNCTTNAIPRFHNREGLNIPFPQGLIVAVILGLLLGLIIGTASLAALFACRRRRQRRALSERQLADDYYSREKLRSAAADMHQDVLYRSYTSGDSCPPPTTFTPETHIDPSNRRYPVQCGGVGASLYMTSHGTGGVHRPGTLITDCACRHEDPIPAEVDHSGGNFCRLKYTPQTSYEVCHPRAGTVMATPVMGCQGNTIVDSNVYFEVELERRKALAAAAGLAQTN